MSACDPPARLWKFNCKTYTSFEDCYAAATASKSSGRSKYWACLEVVEGDDAVKVKCIFCLDEYCATNVAQFAKSHFLDDFSTCVKSAGRRSKRAAHEQGLEQSNQGSSRKRSKQLDIEEFFVPRHVAAAAQKHLYMFFFTNPTMALQQIEDPHLVASFKTMGVALPSRKTLSTVILDRVYQQVHMETVVGVFGSSSSAAAAVQPGTVDVYGVLDLPKLGKTFIIITDGWRKRAAAGGTPLINLLAAAESGRAVFLKVSAGGCPTKARSLPPTQNMSLGATCFCPLAAAASMCLESLLHVSSDS